MKFLCLKINISGGYYYGGYQNYNNNNNFMYQYANTSVLDAPASGIYVHSTTK